MALSVVNGTSANANSAGSVTTAGINITAGNLIVVETDTFDSDGLNDDTSVTDSASNTYTKVGTSAETGTRHVSLWYAKNVTGGASVTFTYTVTQGNDFPRIAVIQIAGADTTAPLDQGANGSFTATSVAGTSLTTPSITTTSAAEILIVAGMDSGATGTESFADGGCATNSGAWTLDQSNTGTGAGESGAIAHAIVSSTGTYCVTQTTSASQNNRAVGIASFIAAAAGGTTSFPYGRPLLGVGR